MSVWKRNAVVVAIVLFVGAAVYLNWSYSKESADGGKDGKLLGQTTLVNGEEGGKGTAKPGETNPGAQASADPSASPSQEPGSTTSTGYFR